MLGRGPPARLPRVIPMRVPCAGDAARPGVARAPAPPALPAMVASLDLFDEGVAQLYKAHAGALRSFWGQVRAWLSTVDGRAAARGCGAPARAAEFVELPADCPFANDPAWVSLVRCLSAVNVHELAVNFDCNPQVRPGGGAAECPPPPLSLFLSRIRTEGTSEAAPAAVRQAVGGGCRSGWGRLLSVTNAIEACTWCQGDSG